MGSSPPPPPLVLAPPELDDCGGRRGCMEPTTSPPPSHSTFVRPSPSPPADIFCDSRFRIRPPPFPRYPSLPLACLCRGGGADWPDLPGGKGGKGRGEVRSAPPPKQPRNLLSHSNTAKGGGRPLACRKWRGEKKERVDDDCDENALLCSRQSSSEFFK